MPGGVIFKVYLAERSDGKCYVGCTKHTPKGRLHEVYHPARWNGPGARPWPEESFETTILFYTTSVAEAARYETKMTLELGTVRPRGLNCRVESGYPGSLRARRIKDAEPDKLSERSYRLGHHGETGA